MLVKFWTSAGERTIEKMSFTIGTPFLEGLITTESGGPDGSGNVAPEGVAVELARIIHKNAVSLCTSGCFALR